MAAPTPTGQGQGGARAATWLENHLPKLRGFRNTEVRMEIAGFLGVRSALDLQRLRAARDVLAALPEECLEECSTEGCAEGCEGPDAEWLPWHVLARARGYP